MWRPEGWDNPYSFMMGGAIPLYENQSRAFEEGADAMYQPAYDKGRREEREALRSDGLGCVRRVEGVIGGKLAVTLPPISDPRPCILTHGVWVFIPDEER